MAIRKTKQTGSLALGTDVKESGITLDKEIIYQVLTEMYSDPIAAVVREVASNAIDSHIVADNGNPIIIQLEDNKFTVTDFGTGISPEIAENHYFKYLSSTRDKDKQQIGMWGLGSKCPLAYTNSLSVETVYEGVYYKYIQFLSENNIPSYTLVKKEKTDKDNQTTVTVPIVQSDRFRFHREMKKLIFNKMIYLISDYSEIDNKVKIYDYKSFKICNDMSFSDSFIDREFILLNDIVYPIDFNAINRSPINLPLGIKFDNNELSPLPSRKDVYYNKKDIEIIQKKYDLAIKEINNIYDKQHLPECNTFLDVLKRIYGSSNIIKLGNKNYNLQRYGNHGITSTKRCYFKEVPDVSIWGCKLYFYKMVNRRITYAYKSVYNNSGYGYGYDFRNLYAKATNGKDIHLIEYGSGRRSTDINRHIFENYQNYVFYNKKTKIKYSDIKAIYKDHELFHFDKKTRRKFINVLRQKEDDFIKKHRACHYFDIKIKKDKRKKKGISYNTNIYRIENQLYSPSNTKKRKTKYRDFNIYKDYLYFIFSLQKESLARELYRWIMSPLFNYKKNILIYTLNNKDLSKIDNKNVITFRNKDNDIDVLLKSPIKKDIGEAICLQKIDMTKSLNEHVARSFLTFIATNIENLFVNTPLHVKQTTSILMKRVIRRYNIVSIPTLIENNQNLFIDKKYKAYIRRIIDYIYKHSCYYNINSMGYTYYSNINENGEKIDKDETIKKINQKLKIKW